MPALSRSRAKPLLRMVNGKQHATDNDHADHLPTPPGTNSTRSSTAHSSALDEEDITRSPVSSDDEQPTTFRQSRQLDGPERSDGQRQRTAFRQACHSSPASMLSKRSSQSAAPSSDGDEMIFGRERRKKQRTSAKSFTNIHAAVARKRQIGYGRKEIIQQASQKDAAPRGPGFKKPRGQEREKEKVQAPLVEFKRALGADMFEFSGGSQETEPRFRRSGRRAHTAGADYEHAITLDDDGDSRSSSLSPPPSTSSEEEMQQLHNNPDSSTQHSFTSSPTTACPICNTRIDVSLKQDFQDKFHHGAPILNYKWQQRFCRWHRQQDAKRIQAERRYPEIDWERLPRRMRRHDAHLLDVIAGRKSSYYREQLSEMLRQGSKTAQKAFAAVESKGKIGSVGYYGPKGERYMTEHIVSHLSDDIRKQSIKDRLVAAVGVSGGVSGFVQAVLVPELAEQLVQEDMKMSSTQAREIMAESTELGDLLHPDV